MGPLVLASGEGPVDTPWKPSRAAALAILAAAHALLIYLLVVLGSWYVIYNPPSAQPIFGGVLERRLGQPLPLAQTRFKPELVRLPITPQQLPDPQITVPADSAPSTGGGTGSSGPVESTTSVPPVAQPQLTQARTLALSHYVAPIYPAESAHLKEEGNISLAALVNAQGTVEQVKILSSTGSPRLDEAAVSAVRQWAFTPADSGAGAEPIWAHANFSFAPPARVLGVPLIIIPYAEVTRELDAKILVSRYRPARAPATEATVRGLLEKLVAAFPGERSQQSGQSLEAQLGQLGSIESLEFLGYINHGVQENNSDSNREDPRQLDRTRWEVYSIRQSRGSSIWLVAVAHGSIQRIEAAVR